MAEDYSLGVKIMDAIGNAILDVLRAELTAIVQTAVVGEIYVVEAGVTEWDDKFINSLVVLNPSAGSITFKLPASPVDKTRIVFYTSSISNNTVITSPTPNLQGSPSFTFTKQNQNLEIVYSDEIGRWLLLNRH